MTAGHKRTRREMDEQEEEEKDKSGTILPQRPPLPSTPAPSTSSHHPSLPRKPRFVTPLSPRKSNQHVVVHHALPSRPSTSISIQAASVRSYPLPPKPATFATLDTPSFKKDLTHSLPPTPPATPALTANGDTIGKINDIPTLLMILRAREQQKIPQQSSNRPAKAVYPEYDAVDYDETPTKKRKL